MVYTTIAPRNKVQEIIINIMEIVSGNNIEIETKSFHLRINWST
ncbi:BnaC01g21200D [Brassica napus]|uniref:BnaC01g21200D protein n=1 Tax=Brassica napus TaxID=3708 RepID=A0A078HFL3_BRANA|nr:BnaC01g21200D [Brassica napus]